MPFFTAWDVCVTLKHTGSTGKFENSKSFSFPVDCIFKKIPLQEAAVESVKLLGENCRRNAP